MDNNMINIDDLVRQRLSGGEEQELPGSWMRMRDLLDKEMPQRPAGFIWRRTYSVIAILLLVAAFSVGGYKLSSFRTIGNATGNGIPPVGVASTNIAGKTDDNMKATASNTSNKENTIANSNQNTLKTKNTDKKLHNTNNTASVKKQGGGHLVASNNIHPNKAANTKIDAKNQVANNNNPVTNNNINETTGRPAQKDQSVTAGNVKTDATDNVVAANVGNTATTGNTNTETTTNKTTAGANTEAMNNMPLAANTPAANNSTFSESKAKTNGYKRPAYHKPAASHNSSTSKTITGDDSGKSIPEHSTSTTAGENGKLKTAKKKKHKHTTENTINGNTPSPTNGDKNTVDELTANTPNTANGSNKDEATKKLTENNAGTKQGTSDVAGNEPMPGPTDNVVAGKVPTDNNPSVTDAKATDEKAVNKTIAVKKQGKKAAGNKPQNKAVNGIVAGSVLAANTPLAGKATKAITTDKTTHKTAKTNNKKLAAKKQKADSKITAAKATDKTNINGKVLAANVPAGMKNNKAATTKKHPGKTIAVKTPGKANDEQAGDENADGNELAANMPSTTNGKMAANNKTTNKTLAAKKAAIPNPNTVLAANTGTTGMSKNGMKKSGMPAHNMGQRQVEKLVVSQQYIKTSATTGYYQIDTLSREIITEEYELGESSFPPFVPYGPPPYNPKDYDNALVAGAGNSMETTTEVKEVAHIKKTKGSTSLENLNAAFNDIKNKFVGAHFAPGITGGINGTFFGPTSFKGFQFGFTGSFIFTDQVSVSADLKYFHRINNNYSLNDNYYAYAPVATGGYTRELVVNPYSFSTLHSIEMPLYIRYTTGNFNFFVGGNFVYEFAINTGAYPLADPTTAQQVSTMGNDNAPKIKAQDFDSRFGIGCLVGASYQVSRKVTFDFRDVQTVWDNGKSTGAKIISNQLYKSPSLQFSIGYNLGGNKERNKE